MTCTCTTCRECEGSGFIFFSMSGEYLGSHHMDDLDQLEVCESCSGRGIEDTCNECLEKEWDELEKEEEHRRIIELENL